MTAIAHRAALLHSLADPAEVGLEASYEYHADGLLLVADGRIQAMGPAAELLPTLPAGTPVSSTPTSTIRRRA